MGRVFFLTHDALVFDFTPELKAERVSVSRVLSKDLPDAGDKSDFGRLEDGSKIPFVKFLKNSVDNTGELLNDKALVDHVKLKRCVRRDMMTKKMDETRYLEFTKARQVSFANKNKHKFSDWIGSSGELCNEDVD